MPAAAAAAAAVATTTTTYYVDNANGDDAICVDDAVLPAAASAAADRSGAWEGADGTACGGDTRGGDDKERRWRVREGAGGESQRIRTHPDNALILYPTPSGL